MSIVKIAKRKDVTFEYDANGFAQEEVRNPTGFRRWVKVAKNQKLLYAYVSGSQKLPLTGRKATAFMSK